MALPADLYIQLNLNLELPAISNRIVFPLDLPLFYQLSVI